MKWNKFTDKNRPDRIKAEDDCYFLDYHYSPSDGGYDHEHSRFIRNFKKEGDKKGSYQWIKHRNDAVKLFANELSSFILDKPDTGISDTLDTGIMAVPSSKRPDYYKYDCRFEDLFNILIRKCKYIKVITPITIKENSEATHNRIEENSEYFSIRGSREPDIIIRNYEPQNNLPQAFHGIKRLIVCDDVITSGGHFVAVRNFLRKNSFNAPITGLFFSCHL